MAGRDQFSALMVPGRLQSVIGGKLFTLWRGRGVASIALILLLLFPFIRGEHSTAGLSTFLWDTLHRLQPRVPDSFPVLIVDIDHAALSEVGQWPWPRWRLAELIDKISDKGPSAIGMDVLMPEPDRLSPEIFANNPGIDKKTQDSLLLLQPNDQRLAASIDQNRVVIGRAGGNSDQPEAKREFRYTPVQVDGPFPGEFLNNYPGLLLNLTILENAAFGHSLVNATPDNDGVVRKMPLMSMVQNVMIPSLALETYRVSIHNPRNINWYTVKTSPDGLLGIQLDQKFIETEFDGSIRPYFSQSHKGRRIPALDVLHESSVADKIKGKIVLIGVTALGLTDVAATPTSFQMDGVEIQAQVLENLINGTPLSRFKPEGWLEAGLLLAGGMLLIVLVPIISPIFASGLYALVIFITLLVSLAGFQVQILIASVYPVVGLTIVFLLLLNSIWAHSDASRRQLARNLFDERLSTERIRGELDAARDIQMGSLPNTHKIKNLPKSLGLHSVLVPAKEVGGDFYDVFMIDHNKLFFVVADVSGKGVPASLFMALSKALCKSAAMRAEVNLSELIRTIDLEISRENSGQLFVTAVLGVVDGTSGRLEFCNAGHQHPLLLGDGNKVRTLFSEGGPPICTVENYNYPVETVQLNPGETLIIVTDGVTEANNSARDEYGVTRLLETLKQSNGKGNVESTVQFLYQEIEVFSSGVEQTDDIAILGIRYQG